jgi:phosphoglycolate phosphatase
MKKLFLFDLDGTLVSTGGAGLRALFRAFRELHGSDDLVRQINPAGKTDTFIFREMIRLHFASDMTLQQSQELTQRYLAYLEEEMKTAVTHVLPGVKPFLEFLVKEKPSVAIGLGTGNLERGARLKLEPVGLNTFFPFGGFGSDAEDRAEVLKAGHRRAEDRLGQKIPAKEVFIIGDTPLDVDAAHRAGFRSVAVASGSSTTAVLQAGRPDFCIESMVQAFSFLDQIS